MTFLKSAVRKWNQNAAAWGGERWERMKNSGTRKAMQTPTWKNVCAVLCLLLLLSVALPVKAAAETAPAKGVGWETAARVQISLTPPYQPIFNDKSLNVG